MSCLFSFLLWGIDLNNTYCLGKNNYVSIFREQRRRRKQRQNAPSMPCGVSGTISEKKNIKNTAYEALTTGGAFSQPGCQAATTYATLL